MAKLTSWIKAARLRTLPLAIASIAMGGMIATRSEDFNFYAVLLAGLTTLLLQILSNFANDYGDFVSGIDNEQRLGPRRTVHSGEISKSEMRKAIYLFVIMSLLSGLFLIFQVSVVEMVWKWAFVLAGILAIVAAVRYTVGENPYGYRGLGDLNVFLFFGVAAVVGTYFLSTSSFQWDVLLPASAMGMLSVGVLNLNNMRDHVNDRLNGKRTIVVAMGYHNALLYHLMLIVMPFMMLLIFSFLQHAALFQYAYILVLPFFLKDLYGILNLHDSAKLDPYLRKHALKTLLLTVLFGLLFAL